MLSPRHPLVRLKVCCISSTQEARLAVAYGASALGLVSAMPSGPGVINEELIASIARTTPPGVSTFLLTCESDPDTLVEQVKRCGTDTVQYVDTMSSVTLRRLRSEFRSIRLVQVLHVEDERVVELATAAAKDFDAVLLDSGRPTASVPELGGTGRVHDWEVSR